MPTLAATARYNAAIATMTLVTSTRKTNKTYVGEYKKFCKWCMDELPHEDLPGYISRANVDAYHTRAIIYRSGNRNSVMRVAVGLQWFYANVEQPGGPAFAVRSTVTANCINMQQDRHKSGANERHGGVDPHKGLKDLMPEGDTKRIVTHIHKNRSDWGSLSMSYTWGVNAGVRGASSRKLVLCDLNLSRGFGPEREGPRCRTLMLILRKGDVHKDNHGTDKQVACWRHRDYLLCSAFNTALHVINSLRANDSINFLHKEKKKRASWWDYPLIEYDTLSQESAAMTEVFLSTGVESSKLTHNRTQAVQRAGSEGLAPWQVNTFTKHLLNKFHTSYQSESDKEACKVMAGFSKDEAHFVAEGHLTLPHPLHLMMRMLLPNYARWCAEAASTYGDKSTCCRKFLGDILPYLVEVLVQGGIYFIRDFPNHEMSNYLKVSTVPRRSTVYHRYVLTCRLLPYYVVSYLFPTVRTYLTSCTSSYVQNQVPCYEPWCRNQAVPQVLALERSRRADKLRALNEATQEAVASLVDRILVLETKLDTCQANEAALLLLARQNQVVQNTQSTQISELIAFLTQQQQQGHGPPPLAAAPPQEETQQPAHPPPLQQRAEPPLVAATAAGVQPLLPQEAVPQTAATVRCAAVQRDAVAFLRATNAPRVPALSASCPKTWVAAEVEWRLNDLQSFLGSDQNLWPKGGIISRYNKRKALHQELQRMGDNRLDASDAQVAAWADGLRGSLTLTRHMVQLRKENPAVASRDVGFRPHRERRPPAPPPP